MYNHSYVKPMPASASQLLRCIHVQAAYKTSKGRSCMVHAQPPQQSWRQRGDCFYEVVITRVGAESPDIGTLTETEMKKVRPAAYAVSTTSSDVLQWPHLKMVCLNPDCSISLQVMLAGLRCAQLLAGANLVHRDLRLANFFWDKDGPFVGDLELAAKAPLQVPLQLCLLMHHMSQHLSCN